MSTLRFILLSQSCFAIFIAGGLFFKNDRLRNRSIALFVLLFGLEIAVFLYSTSHVALLYPHFYGLVYLPIGFLYGPLLYSHISTLQGNSSNRKFFVLHFIPFIVMILLLLDIYFMDGASRMTYISENFFNRIMPYNYARAIHILGYGTACAILVGRNQYTNNSVDKVYAIAVCVIYFIAAGLISFYTWFADNWRQFIYYYLFANTIVLIIGYLLHYHKNFLKELSEKYYSSTLSQAAMEKIKAQIHKKVVVSRAFLDRGLNLDKMATMLGESNHRISQTLSILVGKNFNDYVNFYRIENAKKMLLDSKFDHFKIEAIAIDSGFNNKVTFHKAFVKNTGMTPALYRKENQEKSL